MQNSPNRNQPDQSRHVADHEETLSGKGRFPPLAAQQELDASGYDDISPRMKFYLARAIHSTKSK